MDNKTRIELKRLLLNKNKLVSDFKNKETHGLLKKDINTFIKVNKDTRSFSSMVFQYLNKKNISNVEFYSRCLIDRRTFSKLNNKSYVPSKNTAIALCIGLHLSLVETIDMLYLCGYTLNYANDFDIIIKFFITHSEYDIYLINEYLFEFNQPLLGSGVKSEIKTMNE